MTVTDSKNEAYKADLLIAADGTFSQVFKSLYPLSDNKPVYRGYKVYRGYSEVSSHSKDIGQDRGNASEGTTINSEPPQLSSRYCDYGFQTWGPSLRFACVPTVSGNAWYIAVASKEKVTTSNSSEAGNKASASQHSFTGPFSNSSVTVGDEEFDSLKAVLNKWHSPIREILGGTLRTREPNTSEQGTGVRVSDSYAFKCRETVR